MEGPSIQSKNSTYPNVLDWDPFMLKSHRSTIAENRKKKKCHFHSESLLGHRGRNCEINKSPPHSESRSYMKHNYLMFFSSSCFFLLSMPFSRPKCEVTKFTLSPSHHRKDTSAKKRKLHAAKRQMLSIGADEYFTCILSIRAFFVKKKKKESIIQHMLS